MDPNKVPNTEAELESFRQKWREEVARSKGKTTLSSAASAKSVASSSKQPAPRSNALDATQHTHARQRSAQDLDEVTLHSHRDLGEKQHGRRLDETSTQTAAAASASQDPNSALEHYERAVEKEGQGSLGDSVNLYRKAFKLDHKVHETYKAKHFPPSYFKPQKAPSPSITPAPSSSTASAPASAPKPLDPNPSNASITVPNTAHHSLHGLSPAYQTLISEFSALSILGEESPTNLSPPPPCPISNIPEEILVEILEHLAVKDMSSFVRLAQVCKRLTYLVATEERVWKRLALGHEYGFAAMHYTWTCQLDGKPLGDDNQGGHLLGTDSDSDLSDSEDLPPPPPPATTTSALVPTPYSTYRTLFQRRPRIRFNGCYISTVNYMRPGQSSPTAVSWNSPIHIVTYYRYLRFLRDGTCISLLSTSEPPDVVPHLHIEHMHKSHGGLPSAPMKDALLGRWRLTGPECEDGAGEKEGTLIVETAGATPKYMYKMALGIGSAGRGARNNKLVWQGYWSYNRLTDDWGEFGLKNDRAFYWSRVRSYGMAWEEGGMKR